MPSASRFGVALAATLSILVIPAVVAAPVPVRNLASDVMTAFNGYELGETILEAAKSLFLALATISLVWTMGLLVVRQDIGEMLMELLRFIVVTGTFYWLLINASTHGGGGGFVEDIVQSFFKMVNDSTSAELIESKANSVLARGLHVFYSTLRETEGAANAERILSVLVATVILVICALMAAQFVLALVMAWILGYAGIFLLGFGGARWTSQIAINFYKHVVAVGVGLLALSIIGTVAATFLEDVQFDQDARAVYAFTHLGVMLGASVLMMVLSMKVPQLLYTLVTGSTLGMYAGSASAAGTAIASAGGSARPGPSGQLPGTGDHRTDGSSSQSGRYDSVMDAVQRSASLAGGMSDSFHAGGGSDPFGVPRKADSHRQGSSHSVFADVLATNAARHSPGLPDAVASHEASEGAFRSVSAESPSPTAQAARLHSGRDSDSVGGPGAADSIEQHSDAAGASHAEGFHAIASTGSGASATPLASSTRPTVEHIAVSETHAIHDEPRRATPGSAQDSAVPATAMADQGHEFQAGGVSASRPGSSATTHVSAASVEHGMAAVAPDGEASLVSHPTAWAFTTESQVGVSSDTDQLTVQGAQASAMTTSTAFDSTQQVDVAAVGNASEPSSLVLPGATLTAIPSLDGDHVSTESRTDDDIGKHEVNRISVTQADMASTESGSVSREVLLDGATVPPMPSTDTVHITVRDVPEDLPRRDAP